MVSKAVCNGAEHIWIPANCQDRAEKSERIFDLPLGKQKAQRFVAA